MLIATLVLATLGATAAHAEPQAAETAAEDELLLATGAIDARIAIMSFDALGMEAEIVARLEALFRQELERLSRHPLPSRRQVMDAIQRSRELRTCSGDNACLAKIGRALGVDAVVSGNVAALGDSYILNIKVVSAKTGKEIRRLATDPLRGAPDDLIEGMRVAAYRLLAPEQLLGSITVLTDLVGATVKVDGKDVGKTPLVRPIYKLALGPHELRVEAKGYTPFAETVEVRFQKTTRVVVELASRQDPAQGTVLSGTTQRPAPAPWYSSPWVYAGVGAAAILVGSYIGISLGRDPVVNCGERPDACAP